MAGIRGRTGELRSVARPGATCATCHDFRGPCESRGPLQSRRRLRWESPADGLRVSRAEAPRRGGRPPARQAAVREARGGRVA